MLTQHEPQIIPITQSIYFYKPNRNSILQDIKFTNSIQQLEKSNYSSEKKNHDKYTNMFNCLSKTTSKSPPKQQDSLKNKTNILQPKLKPIISVRKMKSNKKQNRLENSVHKIQKDVNKNTSIICNKTKLDQLVMNLKKSNKSELKGSNVSQTKLNKKQKQNFNPKQLIFSKIEYGSPSFSNILDEFKVIKTVESSQTPSVDRFLPTFKDLIFSNSKQQESKSFKYIQQQSDYKNQLQQIQNGKFKISKKMR